MNFEHLTEPQTRYVTYKSLGFSVKEIAVAELGSASRHHTKVVYNCLSRTAKKLGYGTVGEMQRAFLHLKAPELFDAVGIGSGQP